MPKVDLVKELTDLLPLVDKQHEVVITATEAYQESQTEAIDAEADLAAAIERTTLEYAEDPKKLGSNAEIREAKIRELNQESVNEAKDKSLQAQKDKYDLELEKLKMRKLMDRKDLLSLIVEASKL